MREIAFRAFIDKEVIGEDCGLMHYPNDSSDFELVCNGDGGFSMVVDHQRWVESDRFSIMQYTGLKDRKGAKIFEGDILYVAGLGNCAVTFEVGFFGFAIESKSHVESLSHSLEDIELIIGNIHENPELMK